MFLVARRHCYLASHLGYRASDRRRAGAALGPLSSRALVGTRAWFLIAAFYESMWIVYAAFIAVPLGGTAAAGLALIWIGSAAALSSLLERRGGADQIGGANEAPPR